MSPSIASPKGIYSVRPDSWCCVFVPSMGTVPRFFGFCYRCWDRDGAMAYRIPLNLLVRWWINHVYLPFKNPVTGHTDRATLVTMAVHERGYQRGYQQAIRDTIDLARASGGGGPATLGVGRDPGTRSDVPAPCV